MGLMKIRVGRVRLGSAVVFLFIASLSLKAQQLDEAAVIGGVDATVKARQDGIAAYTVTEHYRVFRNNEENHPAAEMTVKTDYQHDTGKNYTILAESGSDVLRKVVLHSILDNEKRINQPGVREGSWLISANYEMKLKPGGPQRVSGRDCYVLSIKPRQKAPNLIVGTLWVDTRDESIVRIEGTASNHGCHHRLQRLPHSNPIQTIALSAIMLWALSSLSYDLRLVDVACELEGVGVLAHQLRGQHNLRVP
jgi:hypothetical protein